MYVCMYVRMYVKMHEKKLYFLDKTKQKQHKKQK
jgi:hypothetical protein